MIGWTTSLTPCVMTLYQLSFVANKVWCIVFGTSVFCDNSRKADFYAHAGTRTSERFAFGQKSYLGTTYTFKAKSNFACLNICRMPISPVAFVFHQNVLSDFFDSQSLQALRFAALCLHLSVIHLQKFMELGLLMHLCHFSLLIKNQKLI